MLMYALLPRLASRGAFFCEPTRLRLAIDGVQRCEPANRRGRDVIGPDRKLIALLNEHGERLYRLLLRLTLREDAAEDLLQDLVVKLSQADSFATADNPYAYARRAAVNLAFSWIRRRRRDRERNVGEVEVSADDPPPWARLVNVEDIRRVIELMEGLSERDRLLLTMRYFDEASYDEIAVAAGGTAHQTRALCHKAIRQLRAAMGEADGRAVLARTEVKR